MSQQSAAPAAAPGWKRSRGWYVLATAVVLLPVAAFIARKVWFSGPNFTDAEQRVVQKLSAYGGRYELDSDGHVGRLVLEGGRVPDEALEDVHEMPYLRRLSLANSSVTDQGLLAVVRCKRLENLGLTNTKVTDAGLARLHQMTSLQNIWVTEGEKLTPRGIAALKKALPATQVHVMAWRSSTKAKSPAEKTSAAK